VPFDPFDLQLINISYEHFQKIVSELHLPPQINLRQPALSSASTSFSVHFTENKLNRYWLRLNHGNIEYLISATNGRHEPGSVGDFQYDLAQDSVGQPCPKCSQQLQYRVKKDAIARWSQLLHKICDLHSLSQ